MLTSLHMSQMFPTDNTCVVSQILQIDKKPNIVVIVGEYQLIRL